MNDSIGLTSSGAHIGSEFLTHPAPGSHLVQFYEGEEFLVAAVCAYLGAGLRAGDQVVAIVTRPHARAIGARLSELGFDVEDSSARGQLVIIDAQHMLSQFMQSELPDEVLFREQIARLLAILSDSEPRLSAADTVADSNRPPSPVRVRAYGEMVDVLARSGNARAAVALEELWSQVCERHSFALLCAYDLASFQQVEDIQRFSDVCTRHSHVLPAERFAKCEGRAARLREVTRLQQCAAALDREVQKRLELEESLRNALRAHSRVEDELLATVKRERESRARADASQAFKEVFLGVLGHDLRNPLNTILTTTRLMLMRRELEPEAHKRLARVVASGERMHRMIEQILDATRTRLTSGIVVQLGEPRDLVPLVAEAVSELRLAHPDVGIELLAPEPCLARIDPERMSQVVENLLENAVAHGDPARGVRVSVEVRDGTICVGVLNFGAAIDSVSQSLLFDPWKRGGRPEGRSAGLGLGLYISQHVVRAHGGNIAVESTAQAGTRFEIRLPRP